MKGGAPDLLYVVLHNITKCFMLFLYLVPLRCAGWQDGRRGGGLRLHALADGAQHGTALRLGVNPIAVYLQPSWGRGWVGKGL